MSQASSVDHYTILSTDGHAGASVDGYRPYLEERWHDEFDAWRDTFTSPWDEVDDAAERNWSSDRRLADLDADGVVAEVLYPNTSPPFTGSGLTMTPPQTREEFERAWAGLQAHNRWLADFCAEAPGRRAGVAQILLNDVDAAVEEVKWAKEAGLFGGILVPGNPPYSGQPDYYSPRYDPLWAICEELDVTVNHHGGNVWPEDMTLPASGAMAMIELSWYAHRIFWNLVFAGTFDKYPRLKLALTEQGSGWVAGTLKMLDHMAERFATPNSMENRFGGPAANLELKPSEYFARNVWLGASFFRPYECELRHEIGVDRIAWGADYPHNEGTTPFTEEALRLTFSDVPEEEIHLMLGRNAAELYGFDFDRLQSLGIGPNIDKIKEPYEGRPEGATSTVFVDKGPRMF